MECLFVFYGMGEWNRGSIWGHIWETRVTLWSRMDTFETER